MRIALDLDRPGLEGEADANGVRCGGERRIVVAAAQPMRPPARSNATPGTTKR